MSLPSRKTLLLATVDAALGAELAAPLERDGFVLERVESGGGAVAASLRLRPSLVILSQTLPDVSGNDVCRTLRIHPDTRQMGILMVTKPRSEEARIEALEAGADDCIAVDVDDLRELVLRTRALHRRTPRGRSQSQEVTEPLAAGAITLDLSRYEVRVAGQPVLLTPTEFRLLQALLQSHKEVLTRAELCAVVWGEGQAIKDRTVDSYVRRLRGKLGRASRQIQSVFGSGYRLRRD
ncbi:MAG TPA: response regulator transcription factor [Polyangia bacterium]|jgi:DNA-binding response OmpR family regulator|nr:response regulator transcription factor [Polyangia bacterium]